MKVLIAASGIRNPDDSLHRWCVPGLEAAGHRVRLFDTHLATEVFGQSGCQRLLLQTVRAYAIDWVLCCPPYDRIDIETANTLRQLQVPLIGFRYDDTLLLDFRKHSRWASQMFLEQGMDTCHLMGTTSPRAYELAQALGETRLRLWHLPFSSEAIPQAASPKRYDVVFTGRILNPTDPRSPRGLPVRALWEQGVSVHVWGNGWEQVPGAPTDMVGPRLSYDEMLTVIGESHLCLTLPLDAHPKPTPMIKLRNLEVAAVGGTQIQQASREIDRHFEPFEDYIPYRDTADLVAQVTLALKDPVRLQTIGRRAAERVRKSYRWDQWWQQVEQALQEDEVPCAAHPAGTPDPDLAAALATATIALGHACEAHHLVSEARSYYQETLGLIPSDTAAHAGLARLAERAHDDATAIVHWQQLQKNKNLRAFPDSVGPQFGLPGLGQFIEAHGASEAAMHLLQLYVRNRQFDRILEQAELVAHIFPNQIRGLAHACHEVGARALSDRLLLLLSERT